MPQRQRQEEVDRRHDPAGQFDHGGGWRKENVGQPRAVGRDNGDYVFTPFGHLADGNPYDAYLPPDPDDPEGFVRPETGEAP